MRLSRQHPASEALSCRVEKPTAQDGLRRALRGIFHVEEKLPESMAALLRRIGEKEE